MQKENAINEVNRRLKLVREQLKYPIDMFARKLGLNLKSYEKIEIGKSFPSFQLFKNVGNCFPVNIKWLTSGEGQMFHSDITDYLFTGKVAKLDKEVDQDVIKRFKEIRINSGFSQAMFANEIGVTRDVVNSIEQGRQDIPRYVMKALSNKYQINLNWFVGGFGSMNLVF